MKKPLTAIEIWQAVEEEPLTPAQEKQIAAFAARALAKQQAKKKAAASKTEKVERKTARLDIWLPADDWHSVKASALLLGYRYGGSGNVSALLRDLVEALDDGAAWSPPRSRAPVPADRLRDLMKRHGRDVAATDPEGDLSERHPVRLTPEELERLQAHAVRLGIRSASGLARALLRLGCGL